MDRNHTAPVEGLTGDSDGVGIDSQVEVGRVTVEPDLVLTAMDVEAGEITSPTPPVYTVVVFPVVAGGHTIGLDAPGDVDGRIEPVVVLVEVVVPVHGGRGVGGVSKVRGRKQETGILQPVNDGFHVLLVEGAIIAAPTPLGKKGPTNLVDGAFCTDHNTVRENVGGVIISVFSGIYPAGHVQGNVAVLDGNTVVGGHSGEVNGRV